MSLKSAIVDYSAFDSLKYREGVEGLLIGANIGNKSFITFCFPLKDPWTLSSMDLLSTGKTLNDELLKKAYNLIKQITYLLYAGTNFLGFYTNCKSEDLKTYETKLVNPICARLQKKKLELINFYNITDTQNTIVYHLKGLNIEKIDQKPQNVSDSFFHTTSAITIYQNQTYNSEDLSDKMNKSVTERAKQMESDAIITLDNTLVINEQESLDYYLRNKKSNESLFDFHLELPEINKTKEDSLRVLGEFTIKGFLHKKATVCECRKILVDDFKKCLKKRLSFLPNHEEIEDAIEKEFKKCGIFPLPTRDCISLKKKHEFYTYRSFADKNPFNFFINNFLFAENDLLIINSEKIESQEKIWDNYRVIYEKISNENLKHKNQNLDKSSPLIKNVFSNSKETIKNPINEPSEIIKSRQQNQTFSTKTPAQSEISIDNKAEQYKYIFLAVLIVCLIILRVLFKNWF